MRKWVSCGAMVDKEFSYSFPSFVALSMAWIVFSTLVRELHASGSVSKAILRLL